MGLQREGLYLLGGGGVCGKLCHFCKHLPTIGQPVSNKEEQCRVGQSENQLELVGASVSVTASCHNDLQSNDY